MPVPVLVVLSRLWSSLPNSRLSCKCLRQRAAMGAGPSHEGFFLTVWLLSEDVPSRGPPGRVSAGGFQEEWLTAFYLNQLRSPKAFKPQSQSTPCN